jgi:hypothetical protein
MSVDRIEFGHFVTLNSGSPPLLVVDIEGEIITVAYKSDEGVAEFVIDRACCVHVKDDDWPT